MQIKQCRKCKKEKDVIEFPKDKTNKTGYDSYCKICKREKVKSHYLKDPSKQKNRVKKWNENNPDKVKQHSIGREEYQKQWYTDNKDKINEYSRNYNRKKRDEGIYWCNRTKCWKKSKTPLTKDERKLINIHRDKIRKAIKLDRKSSIELLGCNISELKSYIESQFVKEMNWENWGKVWELDHIIGCVNFNLNDPEQLKRCFHYSNMRPLFKTTDIAKSFGYDNIIGNRNRPKKH